VVAALRARLESFQQHLPLVAALRNPGLRERHWAKVAEVAGLQLSGPAGGLTVSRALAAGLPAKLEALEEISEFASKEFALERALDKMQVGVETGKAGGCLGQVPDCSRAAAGRAGDLVRKCAWRRFGGRR
jgi:hypothetical protein